MIDTGPIMRELHERDSSDTTIDEWVLELENKFDKNITSQLITDEIKRRVEKGNYENALLIGIRTIDTIKYVFQKMNVEEFQILYIDAKKELLYQNYLSRERKQLSFLEFNQYLTDELDSGLSVLRDYAIIGYNHFQYFFKNTNFDSFEPIVIQYFGYKREDETFFPKENVFHKKRKSFGFSISNSFYKK